MADLKLRTSGTLSALAKALAYCSEQATNTANVSSGSSHDVVSRYWNWATNATGQLANQMPHEAAQSLIRTPAHWSIRRLDAKDNNAYLYVADELRDRARAFDELRQYVEELSARWTMPGLKVVPDTNIFLHYARRFDLVAWRRVLAPDANSVHLVLPMTVVYELDKAKHNTKKLDDGTTVGTRARKTLQRIDELIPASDPHQRVSLTGHGSAEDIVTVQVLIDPLEHVPLPSPDSEIVDRAAYLQRITGSPVTVVTGDSTMRLLAAANGLQVAHLAPDSEHGKHGGLAEGD